jgi:hypothetical protein
MTLVGSRAERLGLHGVHERQDQIAAYLVTSGVVSGVLAQPAQRGCQGAPMYDMKTEASFAGTVDAVENVTRPDRSRRQSLGGTHLILKTDAERLEVHIGPSAFLMDKKINILKGDVVEVLGSRVTIDGTHGLLAREIKKGTTRGRSETHPDVRCGVEAGDKRSSPNRLCPVIFVAAGVWQNRASP